MAPLNILIVGGGLAGPAAAFWLYRAGHTVTVIERFPVLRAGGAQIDLRAQGLEAVRRMGLLPAVKAVTVAEEGISFIDRQGRAQATFRANTSGQGAQSFTSEYEIMRGDLVRVLYEATKDHVTYHFGRSVDSFAQDAASVTVTFNDGAQATFDLLIGADGQGSRIRKALLPPDVDPIRHLDNFAAYFNYPRTPHDTMLATMCNIPGRPYAKSFMTRSHSDTRCHAYLSLRHPSPDLRALMRAPEADQKAFYAAEFKGAALHTDRVLAALDTTDSWYCHELVQVHAPFWHAGRVVLLGDAACCPSAMSGMGTTSAFCGAYVLAGELASNPDDPARACAAYEATLRPFAAEFQKIYTGLFALITPHSAWGIWVLHRVLGLLAWSGIIDLLSRFSSDEKGGWKLPDYDVFGEAGRYAK